MPDDKKYDFSAFQEQPATEKKYDFSAFQPSDKGTSQPEGEKPEDQKAVMDKLAAQPKEPDHKDAFQFYNQYQQEKQQKESAPSQPEKIQDEETKKITSTLPREKPLLDRLSKNPKDTKAATDLGAIYLSEGKKNEAFNTFYNAVQQNPHDASARVGLAHTLHEQGGYKDAIDNYNAAIQLNPVNPMAYNGRAYSKIKTGDMDGALTDATKAEAFDKDNPAHNYLKQYIYDKQGKGELAQQEGLKADQKKFNLDNANENGVQKFVQGDKNTPFGLGSDADYDVNSTPQEKEYRDKVRSQLKFVDWLESGGVKGSDDYASHVLGYFINPIGAIAAGGQEQIGKGGETVGKGLGQIADVADRTGGLSAGGILKVLKGVTDIGFGAVVSATPEGIAYNATLGNAPEPIQNLVNFWSTIYHPTSASGKAIAQMGDLGAQMILIGSAMKGSKAAYDAAAKYLKGEQLNPQEAQVMGEAIKSTTKEDIANTQAIISSIPKEATQDHVNGLTTKVADMMTAKKAVETADPAMKPVLEQTAKRKQAEVDSEIEKIHKEVEEAKVKKDQSIEYNQKRLGLPSSPEIILSDDAQSVMDKINKGEPVLNNDINTLSDELYKQRKALQQVKDNTNRRYTRGQYDKKLSELDNQIETLEQAKSEQGNNDSFVKIDLNPKADAPTETKSNQTVDEPGVKPEDGGESAADAEKKSEITPAQQELRADIKTVTPTENGFLIEPKEGKPFEVTKEEAQEHYGFSEEIPKELTAEPEAVSKEGAKTESDGKIQEADEKRQEENDEVTSSERPNDKGEQVEPVSSAEAPKGGDHTLITTAQGAHDFAKANGFKAANHLINDANAWLKDHGRENEVKTNIQDFSHKTLNDFLSQPSSYKRFLNVMSVRVKNLSDLIKSKPFIEKGFSGLDVPSQRLMEDAVLMAGNKRKIFDSVVQLLPVDVMDVLRSKQLTPEMLFHDKAMLQDFFTADMKHPISVISKASRSLVNTIADVTTKEIGSSLSNEVNEVFPDDKKVRPALGTNKGDVSAGSAIPLASGGGLSDDSAILTSKEVSHGANVVKKSDNLPKDAVDAVIKDKADDSDYEALKEIQDAGGKLTKEEKKSFEEKVREQFGEKEKPESIGETKGITKEELKKEWDNIGIDSEFKDGLKQDFGVLADEAKSDIETGKVNVDELAEQYADNPNRPVNDKNIALLLTRKRQLQNAIEDLNKQRETATDPSEIAEIKTTASALQDKYETLIKGTNNATTTLGRGLRSVQMALEKDFSLASMKAQIANIKGEALTPEETKQVEDLHKEIAEKTKALEDYQKKYADLQAENEKLRQKKSFERHKAEAEGEVRRDKIRGSKEYLKKERQDLFGRLKKIANEQRSTLSANPIPLKAIPVLSRLARNYIKDGVLSAEEIAMNIHDGIKDVFKGTSLDDVKEALYGKREKPTLSREEMAIKAAQKKAQDKYDLLKRKYQLAQRSRPEVIRDALLKWQRFAILSGTKTLGKLTAAATARQFLTSTAEEGIGWGISKIAPKLAADAPREGGYNAAAEAKNIAEAFKKATYKDILQTAKTGKGELDLLYGKGTLPPEALDFFGQLHSALKVTPKRGEFFRSFEKRMEHAIAHGADGTDPLVQAEVGAKAYEDAQRTIFMNENSVVTAYQGFLKILQNKGGEVPATVLRFLLPIVKIPSNFISETASYSPYGAIRAAKVLAKGIENLSPEQKDYVMRNLKKTTLGGTLLAIGYFNSGNIGGYYQQGEKRKQDDVSPTDVKMFGMTIPGIFLHAPALEMLQFGATIRRIQDKMVAKGKDNPLMTGVGKAAWGIAEQQPFVGETARTTRDFEEGGFGKAATNSIKGFIVPKLIQELATGTDKADLDAYKFFFGESRKRKADGLMENIETGVPGLRENVPLKKGEPESSSASQGAAPGTKQTVTKQPREKMAKEKKFSIKQTKGK